MKPIRIFISSPGDVAEERDKAEAVIRDLDRHYSGRARLVTVRWENLGLGAHASFQEGIVKVLTVEGGVDIAVFILWSRLGTPQGDWALRADGKPYRSGTEQEFDLMLEACRESGGQRPHLLAYVRDDDRAYSAALANAPVTEHSKIVEQRTLARQFVSETFSDAETGRNLRAFHTYDQPVTFADRLRVHLRAVLDRILGDDPGAVRWDERPYRGLEVFDVAHEDIFRGREEQVCEVLRQLRRNAAEGCAFAVIVGASGSGKSSLARAGVAPSLLHHAHDDAKEWRHAIFTPSLAPGALLAGLAEVLAAPGALPELRRQVRDIADLAQTLATDPVSALKLALLPALRAACEAAGGVVRLILVVDQMEELFVPGRVTEEERAAFLRAIETLARHVENGEPGGEPPFRVLATLRSDFYAAAQRDETFLRLKGEHGHCDLLPPDPAALHRIIVEPARLAGIEFEERDEVPLDSRLLAEAVRGADALPLLEYALDALYERRETTGSRPLLTHAAYDAMGGVEGALGGQAEKVFTSLPEEARAAFGPVMQELVTVDASPEAPPLRQRVPLATLRDTPAKETLVNALLEARFLTADSDARTGEAVAGLAHEALLRRWDRLAVWIEANREHLRVRARVEQSQALWERDNAELAWRDPSLLLPEGLPLEEARALLRTTLPRTGTAGYINASITHHESTTSRRRRLRRNVIAALSFLLVAALVAAVWARKKQNEARNALTLASKRARDLEEANAKSRKYLHDASMADYAVAVQRLEKEGKWHEGVAHLARALKWEPYNALAAGRLYATLALHAPEKQTWPREILRHEDRVWSAQFSPDDSRIVTASADQTARIWDAATSKPLGEPLRHEARVWSAHFSPDGSRVVTVCQDHTVRVWDAATGQPVGMPLRHGERMPIWSVQFSPDGRWLVTGSADKTARAWDAATGKSVGEPMPHKSDVRRARFDPDGQRIVTASDDGTARVWAAPAGTPLGEPIRHGERVSDARFSPDGQRILTWGDNAAQVWGAATGQPIGEPLRHTGSGVECARFSPDGRWVVTGSGDKTARVWDAATGQPVGEPLVHPARVISAEFSPDGNYLVTASWEAWAGKGSEAQVWKVATGKPLGSPLRHEDRIESAQFSADGHRIITASWDKTACVWERATGKAQGEPLRHSDVLWDAQFSPDGQRIVTVSSDKTARVWHAVTGKPLTEPLQHERTVYGAWFTPDGQHLVTITGDQFSQVWETATGKSLRQPTRFESEVVSVDFSPDARRIVTASKDKAARVYEAATGRLLIGPLLHEAEVARARFSADGQRIVTASWDKTARVWDAATGAPLGEPLRHESSVYNAGFSSDCRHIVTTTKDKNTRVWDAATGKLLVGPVSHDTVLRASRFSPDGKRIVFVEKHAELWDIPSGQMLGEMLKHEGRVESVDFSRDGRLILTTGDKTARVWEVATGQPVGELLRHESWAKSAEFNADGTRIVTASGDKTARVWEVSKHLQPPVPVAPWMLARARAVAGLEFDADGKLRPISAEKRRAALLEPPLGNDEWAKLARWLAQPAAERTLTPDSKFTCRQIAERERNSGYKEGIESSLRYDPTVPLSHVLLAKFEENPQRADFLRGYGFKLLPNDAILWARAAASLVEQKDFAWALQAADKALALDPKNETAQKARTAAVEGTNAE